MMNDQIKTLWEQAMHGDGPHASVIADFAELIVRECAKVAKKVDGDEGDDYKSGRTWAGIDVLKHFGVEE